MRIAIVIVVVLALLGGGYYLYAQRSTSDPVTYRTAPVQRGELLATISSTGTIEPEETVDVGAQVAGQILSFGTDKDGKTIDYNSVVEANMVLAEIDRSLCQTDVDTALAQLHQAQAGVLSAKANLEQMKAKLGQAQADWDRAQKLGPSEALAQSSYDGYKFAYEIAKANVDLNEAQVIQAQATVEQNEVAVRRAQRNLGYCTITSPVRGVIIDRRVNIGQTVVSSLNAPSLFLIAKDLTRMQVWVSVNEADVGSIHKGQPVTFTVDECPGETFKGEVGAVHLNATMTQNVVTYTVVVETDNSSGKLLPYLSAKVAFETSRHEDVLLVPNSAVRYVPTAEQVAPEFRDVLTSVPGRHRKGEGGATSKPAPVAEESGSKAASAPAAEIASATTAPSDSAGLEATTRAAKHCKDATTQGDGAGAFTHGMVWVQEGGLLKPIKVRVGPSDGVNTEVRGDELSEGLEVVVGEQRKAADTAGTTNPFTPNLARPKPSAQPAAAPPPPPPPR